MIRSFFFNIFLVIHTVIFCLWDFIITSFDIGDNTFHFFVTRPWAKVILWVSGVKGRVTGLDNLQTGKPYIFMSNHQSYFDIFVLLANIPVGFKFIMKQELMKIFLLGPAMRRSGHIGIERKDPKKAIQSMNRAAEKIKNGTSVLIFPEGTRSPDGRLQAFKKGGFHLAVKSGCDIVPVYIHGTNRIVPKGSLRINNKGMYKLYIGSPIQVKGCKKKDIPKLMKQVRDAMLNCRLCD